MFALGTATKILFVPSRIKQFVIASGVFSFVILATPARADKGQSSYKQGRDLEARQDYEAAFDEYHRAYDANPRNTQYRAVLTGINPGVAAKMHGATLLIEAGELEEALALFEDALKIDPSRLAKLVALPHSS